jgi:hypothetical protein
MLPALTVRARRLPPRRVLLVGAGALLAVAALLSSLPPPQSEAHAASLADELHPATWAMQIPTAWLAAPVPRARRGDLIDLLAVRPGDRAFAVPIAYAAMLVASDERGLVLEVDESDASAIATARGSGLLLVPLLRSTR